MTQKKGCNCKEENMCNCNCGDGCKCNCGDGCKCSCGDGCKCTCGCANEDTVVDTKKLALSFISKLWIVLLFTVIGIIIGVISYKIYAMIKDSEPTYQISNDYMIEFDLTEFPNGMDYYNAYTWGQFVKDDKLTEYALEATESITKQDIMEYIDSEMVADYRILTVNAIGHDKSKVEEISKAYETAMPQFASDIREISSIELWSKGEMQTINLHTRTASAAFLGGLIAFLSSIFVLAIYCVLDDRICTEVDVIKATSDAVFLGYDCDGYRDDLLVNKDEFSKDKKIVVSDNISGDLDTIKAAGACIIRIRSKALAATALAYDIGLLKKHGINAIGVELYDCDKRFLRRYYARVKS